MKSLSLLAICLLSIISQTLAQNLDRAEDDREDLLDAGNKGYYSGSLLISEQDSSKLSKFTALLSPIELTDHIRMIAQFNYIRHEGYDSVRVNSVRKARIRFERPNLSLLAGTEFSFLPADEMDYVKLSIMAGYDFAWNKPAMSIDVRMRFSQDYRDVYGSMNFQHSFSYTLYDLDSYAQVVRMGKLGHIGVGYRYVALYSGSKREWYLSGVPQYTDRTVIMGGPYAQVEVKRSIRVIVGADRSNSLFGALNIALPIF